MKVSSFIYRSSVITTYRDSWVMVSDWRTLRNPVLDLIESGINALTVNGLNGDVSNYSGGAFDLGISGPFGISSPLGLFRNSSIFTSKLTRQIVPTIFVASYINDSNGHKCFQSENMIKCKLKIYKLESTQHFIFILYITY